MVVKAGDIWAKLVLMAGRAGTVENSVKAGGKGTSKGELIVTALVDFVDKETRVGDFASMTTFSSCGVLWFLGFVV
jgi:hypothetical protein